MNIIMCVSLDNGLSLDGRRVSRDQIVIDKIKEIAKDNTLYADLTAADLFEGYSPVVYLPSFLTDLRNGIPKNDFCFIENSNNINLFCADKFYIFNWNKKYPADDYFEFPNNFEKYFKLVKQEEFKGNAHDVVTLYEYSKEV